MVADSATFDDTIPRVELPHSPVEDEANDKRRQAINRRPLIDEKNSEAPLSESGKDAAAEKASEGRTKRIVICALLFALLCAGAAVAIWYLLRGGSSSAKSTMRVTTDPNRRQDASYTNDDEKYNAALKSLAGKTGSPDNPLGNQTAEAGAGNDNRSDGTRNDSSSLPRNSTFDSNSGETERIAINEGGGNTQPERTEAPPRPATNDGNSGQSSSQGAKADSVATAGRSTLFSASRLAARTTTDNRSSDSSTSRESSNNSESVTIPPFGSMLPVRSLGMIYTLRSSGSLVRFELTRDVSGRGWSMRKGTVIVGVVRSSEFDRAFISVVGFIDNERGGLVKVTGDLLSGDGASGLRGKRRKVSSGFSRVLGQFKDASLGILSNLASGVGRGGGTVIITDAYSRGVAPITSELDGVINNRQEFIEIRAGTPCYVMVTQLPDEIQGVDALAGMSSDSLTSLSDSSAPRRATGISEEQLAEILSRGNEAEIRRALPRMTPEMRRLAEAVLREGGGR